VGYYKTEKGSRSVKELEEWENGDCGMGMGMGIVRLTEAVRHREGEGESKIRRK